MCLDHGSLESGQLGSSTDGSYNSANSKVGYKDQAIQIVDVEICFYR